MKSTATLIWVLVISAALVGGLTWLSTYEAAEPELLTNESGEVEPFAGPFANPEEAEVNMNPMELSSEGNPVAVFTTNQGTFEIELFADQMPITVGNFTKLVEEDYYDGTKFHRIIEGFMIQGGDPNSKGPDTSTYGTGGPGYTIQDEFVEGELLTNTVGTIAMANTGQPNSGGSQFFINTANNINLDFDKQPLTSRHPVFGRVVSGMEVVKQIEGVETGPRDVPAEPVVIESVTLKTEA